MLFSSVAAGYLTTFVDATQQYVTASPGGAILLAIVSIPFLTIALSVIRQLVSILWLSSACLLKCRVQVVAQDRSLPPEVFHWIPFIGSAISYGNDPLKFLFECREKVWQCHACLIVS
jgi:sterol 14-demethylase